MIMDKQAISHLLQSNPSSFTFSDPHTKSKYLMMFQTIQHEGILTDYLKCKICNKILKYNPLSRTSLSYHYFIHRCPSMNIRDHSNKQSQEKPNIKSKQFAFSMDLRDEENWKRLKRVWNSDQKYAIKKILFRRHGRYGKEYFVTWKYHPNSSCWLVKSWLKNNESPSKGI